ncbi:MAG: hypothetical protein QME57_05495, partial [Patescibacteria group bacterium]|nr:hypothetical protein [Patescibacteria group bacterium]
MNNLLRKIAIGSLAFGLGAIALPVFGAISPECRADLTKCTTTELTEYIAELNATVAALQAQLETLTGPSATPTAAVYEGIPDGFTFTKNLSLGMKDPDVVYLKKVLDVEIPDHAAWTGNEYFGSKTKAAVIAFCQKYKADISAAAGYEVAC